MVYDLGAGYDATSGATDPQAMLHAVYQAANGGVTPPPPVNAPVFTSFTASPASLPAGGGAVTLAWTSTDALSVAISGVSATFPASGSVSVSVTASQTFTATAAGAGGSASKSVSVTVATAPPPPVTYDSAGTYQAGYSAGYGVGFPAGVSSVHKPDSTLGYSLGLAAGKLIGAASVVCPDSVKGYALGLAAGKLQGAAAVKLDSIHAQIYLSNGTIVKE